MRYYHTTETTEAILTDGFLDAEGTYMLGITLRGVFLSDQPVDCNEGANGDQTIAVDLPDHLDLDDYEIVEDLKPYREWCVPAHLINKHATLRLLSEDEVPSRFDNSVPIRIRQQRS